MTAPLPDAVGVVELPRDPMERKLAAAMLKDGVPFTCDQKQTGGLDFLILNAPVYVEVKRFHSDRISDQMGRAENVIAVQGERAVTWFAALFHNHASVVALKRDQERRKNEWRAKAIASKALIQSQAARIAELEAGLRVLEIERKRPTVRLIHLKRAVAVQARSLLSEREGK